MYPKRYSSTTISYVYSNTFHLCQASTVSFKHTTSYGTTLLPNRQRMKSFCSIFQGASSFVVMTNYIATTGQKQDKCPEVGKYIFLILSSLSDFIIVTVIIVCLLVFSKISVWVISWPSFPTSSNTVTCFSEIRVDGRHDFFVLFCFWGTPVLAQDQTKT